MAPRLPRLIAFALAVTAAGASAQEGDSASVGMVTGEMLRRSGAARLSDALLLTGRWDLTSVDGFTWNASPLGGSPFLPARWIVLVDGRRMDLDLFGTTNLDRLGIPLERITGVELTEVPRLIAGRLTSEGVIEVHTAAPPSGPSGTASFATGTEIGDPGPFAFTPRATPNVDRNGHDAWADVGYGGDSWYADATVATHLMVPTDPAIVERYVGALGRDPRLDLTAGSARVAGRIGGSWHTLTVRRSNLGDALALRSMGDEIGARAWFTQAGLAGRISAGDRRELVYDVSHSVNRARSTRDAGTALDWDAATTEGRVELVRPDSPFRAAGVRLRRLAVHSPEDLSEPTIALATVYAELAAGGPGRGGPTASSAVTFGEGEIGVVAVLARRWRPTPGSALDGALSYERTVRAEDNGVWAWSARGLELPADTGVSFEGASGQAPERIGADLRWSARAAHGVTLSGRALFRRSRSLSLERRRLRLDAGPGSFDASAAIVHGAGGEQAGGDAEVALTVPGGLNVRLLYWYRAVLGGDSLFREVWEAVPKHGARALVEYVPVPGLELWLSARYRGSSRWAEFSGVELADAFGLDLAVQKWLWDERLRVHFGVRNVLGANLRFHPAGATFAPTAVLQVALGGAAGRRGSGQSTGHPERSEGSNDNIVDH